MVVVGASWGGSEAVPRLLRGLSPDLAAPVVVVQHRGPGAPEGALLRLLTRTSALPVAEIEDKDEPSAGQVYVAPADYHVLVERGRLGLSLDAPVRFSRPSIDVLFESAAEAYGSELVAVVLTGANSDGAEGVQRVKEHGGTTLVQDPATAERREMPEAAIATGAADRVLAIEDIADAINALVAS
jgi:two-component system chemotaxis response regulator CheB